MATLSTSPVINYPLTDALNRLRAAAQDRPTEFQSGVVFGTFYP